MYRTLTSCLSVLFLLMICLPGNARANENEALRILHEGETYDVSTFDRQFNKLKNWLKSRYDTSDFTLQPTTRIVHEHGDQLSPESMQTLKEAFLNFKYWMDQPGHDGMCYWSENHQIMFSTAEYLAGQYWPDEIFTNDGKTGAEHQEMARIRILNWLEQRWLYGFTEWYSNVYYVEDIAPLANLIDFAADREISEKATIIMDLLLHDLATQSHRGVFQSTSGRMYGNKRDGNDGNSMRGVAEHIWGKGTFGYESSSHHGMDFCFAYAKKYKTPEVIRAIGLDEGPAVIRASTSLNVSELEDEGLIGQNDRQIMMQWCMEAFSNPEVITNSMRYIKRHEMFHNDFLQGFKMLDYDLLTDFNLLPTVSRILRPVTDGSAIQRANTYTYRTPDYMIATTQAYHPGTPGDQHHIWTATLSEKVSLFTTHPAKPVVINGRENNSPGHWVGNGRLPHCVQDENIVLCLYDLNDTPRFLEAEVLDYTHAFFPEDRLTDIEIEGRFAFARHRNTLVAFIGRYRLAYAEDSNDEDSNDELIQKGKDGYWIFEASTVDKEGDIEAFKSRLRKNQVTCNGQTLQYESDGKSLQTTFGGEFQVDGQQVELEHPRFQSPYANVQRKPRTMKFSHDGHTLDLDFYERIRVISTKP